MSVEGKLIFLVEQEDAIRRPVASVLEYLKPPTLDSVININLSNFAKVMSSHLSVNHCVSWKILIIV